MRGEEITRTHWVNASMGLVIYVMSWGEGGVGGNMEKTKRRRGVAGSRCIYTVHITLFWNDILCKYSRNETNCNLDLSIFWIVLVSRHLALLWGLLILPFLLHCFPERGILRSFFLDLSFRPSPPSSESIHGNPPFSRMLSMVTTFHFVPRLLPLSLLSSPLAQFSCRKC